MQRLLLAIRATIVGSLFLLAHAGTGTAQTLITSWQETTAIPANSVCKGAGYKSHIVALCYSGQAFVADVTATGTISAWHATSFPPNTDVFPPQNYLWDIVIIGDYVIVPGAPTSYVGQLAADGTVTTWKAAPGGVYQGIYQARAIATDGVHIWAVGGSSIDTPYWRDDIEMATFNAGVLSSWSTLSPYPVPISFAQLAVSGGYLYGIGGSNAGGSLTNSKDVFKAQINPDGTLGAWAPAGAGLIDYHASPGLLRYQGTTHVIGGGVHGGIVSTIESMTDASIGIPALYSLSASMPVGLQIPGTAVVNNYGFILTGCTAFCGSTSNRVWSAQLGPDPLPPTVSKVISADTLVLGGTTSMTLTLTNPNPVPLTGVALSDIFPAGLTPSNPGGSCTPKATIVGQTLSISGVTLAADPEAGHQCTITATVTGTLVGSWTNMTGAPTAAGPVTLTGVASNPDSITVIAQAPVISKGFNPSTIAVGSAPVLTITVKNPNPVVMTGVSFMDVMPVANLIITPAGDIQSNSCGVNAVGAAGSNTISLTNGTIAANGTCTITLTIQGIAPGVGGAPVVNTTSSVAGTVQTASLTGDPATATLQIGASEISFLVRYASNLAIGDSVVTMTNIGNFSSLTGLPGSAQNGNICANVYTYSPDEQLVSCCSCLVTPNALASLSVNNDLTSNALTPIRPSAVVMKLVASAPGAGTGAQSCNPATVTRAGTANFLVPGLAAWGNTLHALPVTAGTPAGTYGTTETPFALGAISDGELTRMTQLCAFIQANGSGYGICKSCKVGGLGASTK